MGIVLESIFVGLGVMVVAIAILYVVVFVKFYLEDTNNKVTRILEILEEEKSEGPSVTPQEPRWIPVGERLPKIASVYRVTRYYPNDVMYPNYLVDACFFDGSNTWYNDNRINHERGYADNVIAWQENPEPYKAESEG